jgi:hypothetical protein
MSGKHHSCCYGCCSVVDLPPCCGTLVRSAPGCLLEHAGDRCCLLRSWKADARRALVRSALVGGYWQITPLDITKPEVRSSRSLWDRTLTSPRDEGATTSADGARHGYVIGPIGMRLLERTVDLGRDGGYLIVVAGETAVAGGAVPFILAPLTGLTSCPALSPPASGKYPGTRAPTFSPATSARRAVPAACVGRDVLRGRDGGTALPRLADLGLPLDSLPWLGVEKIRTGVVDRRHGTLLRSVGDRAASRGVSSAINHRLKSHLVRSTFGGWRTDPIEGSRRLRANAADIALQGAAMRHYLDDQMIPAER